MVNSIPYEGRVEKNQFISLVIWGEIEVWNVLSLLESLPVEVRLLVEFLIYSLLLGILFRLFVDSLFG